MLEGANANNTPPPNAPAMKIMRRAGHPGEKGTGESTAASSSAPSKAPSEIGEGGSDEHRNGTGSSAGVTPAKDRAAMSREEREAKYQEARERIFRDFPESKSSENSASAEHSANMSRSSSMSGRKKSHRQKTPHDDSFEARSQFNAFYPGMPYSSGQVPVGGMNDGIYASQGQYMPGSGSSPSVVNHGHNGQANPIYAPQVNFSPMAQYSSLGMSPNIGQGNSWQGGQIPPQTPYSGYPQVNQPPQMMSQQSSARSSPSMNNYALPNAPQYQQPAPSWTPSAYAGGGLQQPANPRNPPPVHWPNYPPQAAPNQIPYQYGQVPNQPYNPGMQNSGAQHPLPGSFNRPAFNPQTRSFVPGGNSPVRYPGQVQQPSVNVPYMKPQGPKPQPWTPPQDNQGYPPQVTPNSHPNKPNMPTNQPNYAPSQRGSSATQDSIAKWGTPSHLPPKPPPSQVPSEFDAKNRPSTLPTQSYPSNVPSQNKSSPLVVSGGTAQKPNNGTS